jgi:hypothetical protein
MVDAKLAYQHVEDVFEAGAEPTTAERKVKIGHPRYRGSLGNPSGKLLPTG